MWETIQFWRGVEINVRKLKMKCVYKVIDCISPECRQNVFDGVDKYNSESFTQLMSRVWKIDFNSRNKSFKRKNFSKVFCSVFENADSMNRKIIKKNFGSPVLNHNLNVSLNVVIHEKCDNLRPCDRNSIFVRKLFENALWWKWRRKLCHRPQKSLEFLLALHWEHISSDSMAQFCKTFVSYLWVRLERKHSSSSSSACIVCWM